jgi:hypothetical protein
MRKALFVLIVLVVTAAFLTLALAETRENNGSIKLPFGGSYHKSVAEKSLNYLRAVWDANGLRELGYQVGAFRGKVTLVDVYVVNGGQTLYKRSEHKKLGIDLSYTDLTEAKTFFDRVYFPTPIKPFTMEAGEIWWLVNYIENGEQKDVVVIWTMKDNKVDWKPLKK